MEDIKKPTIGITLGDINGIGPQIVLKALAHERLYTKCNIIVFGSNSVMQHYKKMIPNYKTIFNELKSNDKPHNKIPNIVECAEKQIIVNPGISSDFSGSMSIKFLDEAFDYYKKNMIDVLVTAPLNKSFIKTNPQFSGHTEYIADKLNEKNPLMIMSSEYLKIALCTHHVALKDVSQNLNQKLIFDKICSFEKSLKVDFGINRPKIAVLALNPHASDSGRFGIEETEYIMPAIKQAMDKNIICQGPFPSDGFFGSCKFKHFDGVLAMYHDQGLIPFKYITDNNGVNFTSNISLIRTSPDHGVALDIANSIEADETSLVHSIYTAIDVFHKRQDYNLIQKNKLQKIDIKKNIVR